MARLNTYTRTSQPSDSDVFVIDSTTGSAGTRTVLWSSIKALFAAAKHSHAASDIASGTLAVDRLPQSRCPREAPEPHRTRRPVRL